MFGDIAVSKKSWRFIISNLVTWIDVQYAEHTQAEDNCRQRRLSSTKRSRALLDRVAICEGPDLIVSSLEGRYLETFNSTCFDPSSVCRCLPKRFRLRPGQQNSRLRGWRGKTGGSSEKRIRARFWVFYPNRFAWHSRLRWHQAQRDAETLARHWWSALLFLYADRMDQGK